MNPNIRPQIKRPFNIDHPGTFLTIILVRDNYPKFVVTMDDFKGIANQGIIHSNLEEKDILIQWSYSPTATQLNCR
jgi:hypothetical protein